MDMTATSSDSSAIPQISGTSNIDVKPLSDSVSALVIIHAICLAGSFILLFPLGVVALRWFGSFRLHWILQIFATSACVLGLVLAIALSALDPEYDSFDEGHQIIGIIVVVVLIIQAMLGYSHHRTYKKLAQRTWVSHSHLWVGRVVIALGMINAILYVSFFFLPFSVASGVIKAKGDRGFALAGSVGGSIAIAIIAVIIFAGTLVAVYFGIKRHRFNLPSASPNPSSIVLGSYEPRGHRL